MIMRSPPRRLGHTALDRRTKRASRKNRSAACRERSGCILLFVDPTGSGHPSLSTATLLPLIGCLYWRLVTLKQRPHFRDDTLVSLLKAPSSPESLSRHKAQLLANGNTLLKRIIHLTRVACMAAPTWLRNQPSAEVTFSVPDGSAWAAVLKLVHENLDDLGPRDRPFLPD